MPFYRKHGKILTPMTDTQFQAKMLQGHFVRKNHKAYAVLLYYSAVRKTEALRSKKEQFTLSEEEVSFSVGKRLKHGIETPSLNIPVDAPYVSELITSIEQAKNKKRVFTFCPMTAWNILDRIGFYPHFFRLSRITNFFLEGWTIAQVRSWTGLTLNALNYYIGLVDIQKMGKSLAKSS